MAQHLGRKPCSLCQWVSVDLDIGPYHTHVIPIRQPYQTQIAIDQSTDVAKRSRVETEGSATKVAAQGDQPLTSCQKPTWGCGIPCEFSQISRCLCRVWILRACLEKLLVLTFFHPVSKLRSSISHDTTTVPEPPTVPESAGWEAQFAWGWRLSDFR